MSYHTKLNTHLQIPTVKIAEIRSSHCIYRDVAQQSHVHDIGDIFYTHQGQEKNFRYFLAWYMVTRLEDIRVDFLKQLRRLLLPYHVFILCNYIHSMKT